MSTSPNPRASIVPAILLAAGITAAGFFIGAGFSRFRTADRVVSVKGVAVPAPSGGFEAHNVVGTHVDQAL